jgi:hypothetical protein
VTGKPASPSTNGRLNDNPRSDCRPDRGPHRDPRTARHPSPSHRAEATGTLGGLPVFLWPLIGVLILGGIPLVLVLAWKLIRGAFASDLLAGISIVMSVVLSECLAGSLVVLMLSGGAALCMGRLYSEVGVKWV